ncbi:MAG TPA: Spy/CpxP family protein refolding chaperone, partial [Thermodesulfobacteriota bacterium]
SFAAFGYPGKQYGQHGSHDWWNKTEVMEQLKLTDQQKSQIEEITSANKEKTENLRALVKTDKEGLREMMKDPTSTRDQILSKFDQAGEKHGELRKAEFEMLLDIRDVLTPEQKTALYELKEQRMKHHKGDK